MKKEIYWMFSTYVLLALVLILSIYIIKFDRVYNFNDNLTDCENRGGDYAFSTGRWNYETCTIETKINY